MYTLVLQMEPAHEQNLLCRGTAENCQEFKLGKAPYQGSAAPLPPPHFILQNQGKTVVVPVLPPMTPLLWKTHSDTLKPPQEALGLT